MDGSLLELPVSGSESGRGFVFAIPELTDGSYDVRLFYEATMTVNGRALPDFGTRHVVKRELRKSVTIGHCVTGESSAPEVTRGDASGIGCEGVFVPGHLGPGTLTVIVAAESNVALSHAVWIRTHREDGLWPDSGATQIGVVICDGHGAARCRSSARTKYEALLNRIDVDVILVPDACAWQGVLESAPLVRPGVVVLPSIHVERAVPLGGIQL